MTFAVSIARVLLEEGGYVFNAADPGGETNFGITWPVLREAIAEGIVPAGTTIKGLTRDQAVAIYLALFWLKVDADQMAPILADDALDFAVNSGIPTAIRKLQAALGVADDGNWGPVTKAAAAAMPQAPLILRYLSQRQDFERSLSIWPTFGKGMAGRIAQKMRDAADDLLSQPS